MITVLLVIHLMVAIAMIGVVLLQRSEGGGLGIGGGGGGGGMSGFLTGRGTANLLTRTTAILAAMFMTTSILLTILSTQSSRPRSILDELPATAPVAPVAPAPGAPESSTAPQPAEPAAPAQPSVPVE
ncbi:MAG: preprotein translocase subunit SecG [Alphaproteobacteria bacterium]|nr:MAG: preprotein translocase subunit SecG [Alphaproteobacteria bacterium]